MPWCERCLHRNRQLRDYLSERCDYGRQAIIAWESAAGVSLDHMDYEHTAALNLHDRIERHSQICQNCTANARCESECQNPIISTSAPGSSASWSEGELSGNILEIVLGGVKMRLWTSYCQVLPPWISCPRLPAPLALYPKIRISTIAIRVREQCYMLFGQKTTRSLRSSRKII